MSSLPSIPCSIGLKRMCILYSQSIIDGLVDDIGLGHNSTEASRAEVFGNPALQDEVAYLDKQLLWAENELAKLDWIEAKWIKEQQQRRSNGVLDLHGRSFVSPLAEARADQPYKETCGRCGLAGHQTANSRHCRYYQPRAGHEDEGQDDGHTGKRQRAPDNKDDPAVGVASQRARVAENSETAGMNKGPTDMMVEGDGAS